MQAVSHAENLCRGEEGIATPNLGWQKAKAFRAPARTMRQMQKTDEF